MERARVSVPLANSFIAVLVESSQGKKYQDSLPRIPRLDIRDPIYGWREAPGRYRI